MHACLVNLTACVCVGFDRYINTPRRYLLLYTHRKRPRHSTQCAIVAAHKPALPCACAPNIVWEILGSDARSERGGPCVFAENMGIRVHPRSHLPLTFGIFGVHGCTDARTQPRTSHMTGARHTQTTDDEQSSMQVVVLAVTRVVASRLL